MPRDCSQGTTATGLLWCGHAKHLQLTTREHFDPTRVSAMPAEVVDAKSQLQAHKNSVPPKELDDKWRNCTFVHLVQSSLSLLRSQQIEKVSRSKVQGWTLPILGLRRAFSPDAMDRHDGNPALLESLFQPSVEHHEWRR